MFLLSVLVIMNLLNPQAYDYWSDRINKLFSYETYATYVHHMYIHSMKIKLLNNIFRNFKLSSVHIKTFLHFTVGLCIHINTRRMMNLIKQAIHNAHTQHVHN